MSFQLQSMSWMLDAEQQGITKSMWTEINVGANTFYVSLPFGSVQYQKPAPVRGGLLAEAMGLGKTVICLGLILLNPASDQIAVGRKVKLTKDHSAAARTGAIGTVGAPRLGDGHWPITLDAGGKTVNVIAGNLTVQTEEAAAAEPTSAMAAFSAASSGAITVAGAGAGKAVLPKSGGTLVVCAVSLVSQWAQEAASKLDGSLNIHAYHGSSRKRNPDFLATQDIVITTYGTLSSDNNYWAKKSGSDYVPPLEKIEWHVWLWLYTQLLWVWLDWFALLLLEGLHVHLTQETNPWCVSVFFGALCVAGAAFIVALDRRFLSVHLHTRSTNRHRVILDESHMIKGNNKSTDACKVSTRAMPNIAPLFHNGPPQIVL